MTLPRTALLAALASALVLSACGGGGGGGSNDAEADVAAPLISPMHELADAEPPVPSGVDADGSQASAAQAPGTVALSSRSGALAASGNGETASAAAAVAVATYYTPAQIRAAYGLDKLAAASSSNKGAYQGSGQTIAIINAFHNPNIANDLAVFNRTFGLPGCSVQNLGTAAVLPLARAAAGSGCSFSVVYATASGTIAAKAPALDVSWKTESSLDVEWAHAIAPMARVILIEAASAGRADLLGAIALAGKLGANVVSMSFGSAEFDGQSAYDTAFSAPGVSYVAASGDSGRGVSWPAVSAQVLAVGGSTLAYSGGARSETAWLGSGGGISNYSAAPAWQTALKVMATNGKVGTPTRRAVPDVAFNANPHSGQMLYITPTLATDTGWHIAGGTSIGTPQWAGMIAIANAVRATAGRPALGSLAAPLYKSLTQSGTYAAALLDVTQGSNGNCLGCGATAGYDLLTGLGTPNAAEAVNLMAGF
jgi:subtilase family serine protease